MISKLKSESKFQVSNTRLVLLTTLSPEYEPSVIAPIASVWNDELSRGGVITIFIFEELVTELKFFSKKKLNEAIAASTS